MKITTPNKNLNFTQKTFFPINNLFIQENNYFMNDNSKRLYKQKRFSELAQNTPSGNLSKIYETIKNNTDFKELKNSIYFNQLNGFFKLLNIVHSLEEQRKIKLAKPVEYRYPLPTDYSKYDTKDYLKFLNNFIKSNFSRDLKEYYINERCLDIDTYYKNLNHINFKNTDIKKLLPTRRYLY